MTITSEPIITERLNLFKNVQFWTLYRISSKSGFRPFWKWALYLRTSLAIHSHVCGAHSYSSKDHKSEQHERTHYIYDFRKPFDTLCSNEQGWLHEEEQLPTFYYLQRKKEKRSREKKGRNRRRKREKRKKKDENMNTNNKKRKKLIEKEKNAED